jgi:hypothetical protein
VGRQNPATDHPNGIFISYRAGSTTVRYSYFHQGTYGSGIGERIFFEQSGASDGWKIYGNIFENLQYRSIQITSSQSNLKVFNNIWYNSNPAIQVRTDQGGACASGSETRNNIFFTAPHDSCGTMSNNPDHSSPNPFVGSGDYHIVGTVGTGYPRNAGTNLSSCFTTDRDGNAFGADGAWDIGAYEYASGSTSTAPAPPTGLRQR